MNDQELMSDEELGKLVLERLDELKKMVLDRLDALEQRADQLEERQVQAEALCEQRRDRADKLMMQYRGRVGRLAREVDGLRCQIHSVAENVAQMKLKEPLPPIVLSNPSEDLLARFRSKKRVPKE